MARSLESRIEKLEAESPLADENYPVAVIVCQPWCTEGLHELPYGYLRGYGNGGHGYIEREPGEAEEELKARSLEIAKEQRGPRCGIVLIEDREMVKCTHRHGVVQVRPRGTAV